MKRSFLFILLLLIVITFSSCISNNSKNGQNDPFERMKTPIWTENDLEIIKYKDEMLSIHEITFFEQPPFYSGSMPIKIKNAKRVIIPGSYGGTEIAVICLHDFGDFNNFFVYEEKKMLSFWLVGARTYTYNSGKPILVAEAKIDYSINQEKRVIELEEFHYGQDDKLEFYSKSEIDPYTGFKIEELEKMGKKLRDYYFIVPIGPMWS